MGAIVSFFKDYGSLIAIVISIVSLRISYKKYSNGLATLTKDFCPDLNDVFVYKAHISLRSASDQIKIEKYRLYKKRFCFYRYYKEEVMFRVKYTPLVVGTEEIDLSSLATLSSGSYKLKVYFDRHPKCLSITFKLPFDNYFKRRKHRVV